MAAQNSQTITGQILQPSAGKLKVAAQQVADSTDKISQLTQRQWIEVKKRFRAATAAANRLIGMSWPSGHLSLKFYLRLMQPINR
jgi:hypothetical protein